MKINSLIVFSFIFILWGTACGSDQPTTFPETNIELKFYDKVISNATNEFIHKTGHYTDCITFVDYIFSKAGMNLIDYYDKNNKYGGVGELYAGLEKYGFIYVAKNAKPGDLIFFDFTVSNEGPLSHIGIIITNINNTLEVIHYAGYSNSNTNTLRVEISKINLYYSQEGYTNQQYGKYNSDVCGYSKTLKNADKFKCSASYCFRAFAHIYATNTMTNKWEIKGNKNFEQIFYLNEAYKTNDILQLLSNQNNLKNRNIQGQTILMWAALRGQKGTFKLLNKNNNIQKYINLKDKNGMTALMFAAWKGNVDNVKFLIDNGADIDAQDNDGETALITACNFGKTDVIKTLISNKVNANLIDKNGWTALKWAHEQTNSNLINLLTN